MNHNGSMMNPRPAPNTTETTNVISVGSTHPPRSHQTPTVKPTNTHNNNTMIPTFRTARTMRRADAGCNT